MFTPTPSGESGNLTQTEVLKLEFGRLLENARHSVEAYISLHKKLQKALLHDKVSGLPSLNPQDADDLAQIILVEILPNPDEVSPPPLPTLGEVLEMARTKRRRLDLLQQGQLAAERDWAGEEQRDLADELSKHEESPAMVVDASKNSAKQIQQLQRRLAQGFRSVWQPSEVDKLKQELKQQHPN